MSENGRISYQDAVTPNACQASVEQAGDDGQCGEDAVSVAVDPEFGMYHVCEEHRRP